MDTNDSTGANALVKFALRLFAIVPNSAGVERLFSMLGIVVTKHRNRLGVEKARKVVLVKADINRVYGTGRQEQHRDFDADLGAPSCIAASPSSSAPTASTEVTGAAARTTSESDALLDSDAVSFHAVAAELLEMVAQDVADHTAGHGEENNDSDLEDSALPPPGMPVPRGAAAYQLKWLFEYPAASGASGAAADSTLR